MSDRTKVLASLLTALSLVALCISLYLTWTSWQTEAVAGCNGDGIVDCDAVLSSHWSQWLGMPVSLFGSITYLAILSICWPAAKHPEGKAGSGLLALSLLAAGAAVWFIAVQAIFLQSFCFYCLSVHACGLSIAGITLLLIRGSTTQEVDYNQMRSLLGVGKPVETGEPGSRSTLDRPWYPLIAMGFAAVGVVVLMGGQLLFVPEGMIVESIAKDDFSSAEEEETEDQTFESISLDDLEEVKEVEEVEEVEDEFVGVETSLEDLFGSEVVEETSEGSRRLFFEGLQKTIDLADYPIIGNPDATHIIVEMLDYTCDHCRHLHPFIESTLEQYGDQIAFVVHHVPLHSSCNRHIKKDRPEKKHACDYAKLAIGVWKLAPEEFQEFHSWLMESEKPPAILEARKRALNLAGEGVLIDDTLKAELEQIISEQCDAFHRLKSGLPILLTEKNVIKGVPRSEKQWGNFLEGQLGITSFER